MRQQTLTNTLCTLHAFSVFTWRSDLQQSLDFTTAETPRAIQQVAVLCYALNLLTFVFFSIDRSLETYFKVFCVWMLFSHHRNLHNELENRRQFYKFYSLSLLIVVLVHTRKRHKWRGAAPTWKLVWFAENVVCSDLKILLHSRTLSVPFLIDQRVCMCVCVCICICVYRKIVRPFQTNRIQNW